MDEGRLCDLIERACGPLRRAVDEYYWPALHGNEMPARNISFYVAHELARRRYVPFFEAGFPTAGSIGHLDVLALSHSRDHSIAIEAKRLVGADSARALANDYGRVNRFGINTTVQKRYGLAAIPARPKFGVLLASVWGTRSPSGGRARIVWQLPSAAEGEGGKTSPAFLEGRRQVAPD